MTSGSPEWSSHVQTELKFGTGMLGHGGEDEGGEVYVDQFKRQVEQARSRRQR